jgi:uncharacterized HAD superfamily protein/hypoxanthine phosphoribosyltransferase
MYGFMSIAQLSADIRGQVHRIPGDVDLVVGIPRSGMIPAYLVGLFANKLVVDLETFLSDGVAGHGVTRNVRTKVSRPGDARHILLIDDSLASGRSMRGCVDRIRESAFDGRMTTCAAVVAPCMGGVVDLFFREMPEPRIFEWNAFHHPDVSNSCFDLDGLLCVDPSESQNDDGPLYEEFLRNAQPRFVPEQRIGHIVSARLEKHRGLTEEWLRKHGVVYGSLHLIDLPSKAERERLKPYASHKSRVYRSTSARLFFESEPAQASEIAEQSERPVLCTTDMTLYLPTGLSARARIEAARWQLGLPLGRLKRWLSATPPLRGLALARRRTRIAL